jgi:hypothetical protein
LCVIQLHQIMQGAIFHKFGLYFVQVE